MSIALINAFEVPEGDDHAFLREWEQARAFLSTQDGYITTRLHRSLVPAADFRFINVAHWTTPQAFQAATAQDGFKSLTVSYPFHASLYEVLHDDAP